MGMTSIWDKMRCIQHEVDHGLNFLKQCALQPVQRALSFTFAEHLHSPMRPIKNTTFCSGYSSSELQPQPWSSSGSSFMVANATPESEISEDPASQVPRTVSPVPTEILDDPPVEDIIANVVAHGIKIRDFASMEEVSKSTLKPVPEIFDPFLAVAEFEYRLDDKGFRWPIPGKMLRRLLVIGWVSQEEVAQRCAPMDIDALKMYDMKIAVDIQEGLGVYPWRSLKWAAVPTEQGRKRLVMKYMQHFVTMDRARIHLEALERKEKLSQVQAEEEERLVREILRRQGFKEKGRARMGVLPEDWGNLTSAEPFSEECCE
ncbi:hypothetical protein F5887DRAFT_918706 [Amanita rubescens]|nr:hypothetical protein F5887DRAFT_918706 [Amanita rubescens]